MADESPAQAQEEAPKKKVRKKKAHKSHKFHADHKVAKVEEPPPPPPPEPTPEPPPPTPEPPPPPAVVVEEKDDSGFYIGGGAGSFNVDVTGINVNGAGANVRMKGSEFGWYGNVGYNFDRNWAIEVRAGGVGTEAQTFEGGPILGTPGVSVPFVFIADTDAFYSAFLKGTVPLGDTFGVYGLIGASHYVVDVAADIGPLVYRDDFNNGDLSYGGGIEARLGDTITLGAEYVKYVDDSDGGVAADLEGAAARLQFRF